MEHKIETFYSDTPEDKKKFQTPLNISVHPYIFDREVPTETACSYFLFIILVGFGLTRFLNLRCKQQRTSKLRHVLSCATIFGKRYIRTSPLFSLQNPRMHFSTMLQISFIFVLVTRHKIEIFSFRNKMISLPLNFKQLFNN